MDEYSLWLTLDDDTQAATQFQSVIDNLADAHDDAPTFEPHVTVVGGIAGDHQRLTRATQELAAAAEPVDLHFGDVQCSTTSHQCVFVLADPSLELLRLRRQAMGVLGRPAAMYVPHLSLIYSEMDLEHRFAVAEAIDTTALPAQARFTTVELVDTTGPVTSWESSCSVRL
jgi:2'-5' RNA ligase